ACQSPHAPTPALPRKRGRTYRHGRAESRSVDGRSDRRPRRQRHADCPAHVPPRPGARGTLTAWRMPRLAAGPAGPAALPDGARDATEGSALDVCAVPRTSPAMSLPPPLAGEGRGGGGRARPPL